MSTGINLEDQLLHIALNKEVDCTPRYSRYSGVRFFSFDTDSTITAVPVSDIVLGWPFVVDYSFKLSINDHVNQITSSLNRYGYIILQTKSRESINEAFDKYEREIKNICLK